MKYRIVFAWGIYQLEASSNDGEYWYVRESYHTFDEAMRALSNLSGSPIVLATST